MRTRPGRSGEVIVGRSVKAKLEVTGQFVRTANLPGRAGRELGARFGQNSFDEAGWPAAQDLQDRVRPAQAIFCLPGMAADFSLGPSSDDF